MMARSRNIKPGFFHNDELAEIEPLGRLLFAGLWTIADREGRLRDRPKWVKAEILPYDDCDVDKLLNALHDRKFITRYENGGQNYIAINNWKRHQNPHMKEQASEIPTPTEEQLSNRRVLDLHYTSTILEQNEHITSPADSLNLIPDSLNLIPYKEIVEFLNQKVGTQYRPSSNKTQALIRARWNEGFRIDDFKKVIENKVSDWKSDPKMVRYLRPETLFGTKFESYLNAPTMDKPGGVQSGHGSSNGLSSTENQGKPKYPVSNYLDEV